MTNLDDILSNLNDVLKISSDYVIKIKDLNESNKLTK